MHTPQEPGRDPLTRGTLDGHTLLESGLAQPCALGGAQMLPGDTAGCRTEELKPHLHTLQTTQHSGLSLSTGEPMGKGVQEARGGRQHCSPQLQPQWEKNRLPGSGQMEKRRKTVYCEKTLPGDQRSHPREGLDFWRKKRQREKWGISTSC